ncbi:uncharacterized protein [Aegilops tauschii subsp. strangulata]|uniref:uncharacterized protein n=1 Tax=Aegilops tauschii subsp. strangulata TaxID=200361 RepID=UPI003CC8A348
MVAAVSTPTPRTWDGTFNTNGAAACASAGLRERMNERGGRLAIGIRATVDEGPWWAAERPALTRHQPRLPRDTAGKQRLRSARRRGRSRIRRNAGEVVVPERVIREAARHGGTIVYPTLTSTNYIEWALVMQINLRAQGLWEAMLGEGMVTDCKDMAALAALIRAVPPEMHDVLGVKNSAYEAWEAVRTMRMVVTRIREATAQRLRSDFEQITFRDGEALDGFAMRITTLVNNLRSLGDNVEEVRVVQKFLRVVPARYTQIACAIETLLDLRNLTVEELVGRLRSAEERYGVDAKGHDGQLLLTEQEWYARKGQQGQGSGSSGGGGQRQGKPQGGGGGQRRGRDMTKGLQGTTTRAKGPGPAGAGTTTGGPTVAPTEGEPCQDRRRQREPSAGEGLHPSRTGTCTTDVHGAAAGRGSGGARRCPGERASYGCAHERDAGRGSGLPLQEAHADDVWFLDTGASNHMTGIKSVFSELDTGIAGTVKFGDGSIVEIQGRGTIIFGCRNGEHRALTDVYYIPRLRSNIISLGQLGENGSQVLIEHGVLRLRDQQQRILIRVERMRNRLYVVTLDATQPVCLAVRAGEQAWRWHERYGHLNFDALCRLSRHDMVRGLQVIEHAQQLCDSFLAGKQRRASFPQAAKGRANGLLDLVHGDLCGPIAPATAGGKRYFLLLVDDLSRYMWLTLLTTKDEAATAIKHFKAEVEVETGRKLRLLRTDRGGEFTSATFTTFCAEEGMGRQLTAPYSPQQSRVVERRNQMIVAAARSLMKAKGVVKPHAAKLDDRSTLMIFLGYEPGTAAYRVYNPARNRVHVSRDVVFDESARWDWEANEAALAGVEFTVDTFSYTVTRTTTCPPASTDPDATATPLKENAATGSPAPQEGSTRSAGSPSP